MRRFVLVGFVVSMLATASVFAPPVVGPAAAAAHEDGPAESDNSGDRPTSVGAVATITGTAGDDRLCVATEIALGGVFGKVGGVTAPARSGLVRMTAVACGWGAADRISPSAPTGAGQQLLDEFYTAGTARLRQLAGFAGEGVFGPDPGDTAIRSLATQLDGRVVAVDRGRDALSGGDFQGVGLIIDSRAQSADSILRLLDGGA